MAHVTGLLLFNLWPVLQDGPFPWDEPLQGLILSSYFWGYLVSQLPAGRMAEMFSAKWVLFVSALLNIVGCLLTPSFSYLHYSGLLVLRVLQGIGGGLSFPAMHVMIAKWAPPQERSVISSVIYADYALIFDEHVNQALVSWPPLVLRPLTHVNGPAGMALGTVISMLMTGAISAALGWEAKALKVPWVKILTSLSFWGILVAHICSNSGWYMMLIELPTYMNQILKFSIAKNALLSSMPFLIMWFFSIALSKSLDIARNKKYITTTTARKIATGIATLVPCVCLVAVSFIGCDRTGAVALMTVGTMAIGGMFSGFLSNHIDIAPNFAGENQRLVASCMANRFGRKDTKDGGKIPQGRDQERDGRSR
ncbi:unnamed protein product [Timema podura]|uniref:Uncharacterized protein n=1 Tax=Timema podura TaxID=61482 RepID=A0ABN7NZ38_TIMPD|nr:unnamed protein product [Timema podura]